ncbi:MAG: metallophosphoesterase family protein [Clostridia bacterium]|nr:metallophosphoesterase family protein [Clostridia bacterium]
MRKKWLIRMMLLAAVIALAVAALDQRMIVRRYTVESDKIDQPVRLALLTDFHGCDYGENGERLVQAVTELRPDAILLSGDMFSADGDAEEELAMLCTLAALAPTLYVTGNHEYWEYPVPALCQRIEETGVTVLDQTCRTLALNGQRVNFCGVPDPYAYVNTETALARAAAAAEAEAYTVLLSHRPELIERYAAQGTFDLVVSGHAHGGQIRIPLLVNGLFAPNQGWLPAYAGGRYEMDGMVMIVSRGLSDQLQMGIPRVFNRPELVLVELK